MKGIHKHSKRSALWPFLAVSVLLNVAGAAWWGLHLSFQREETASSPGMAVSYATAVPSQAMAVHDPASSSTATKATASPSTAAAQKFHWSQIESDDYCTYISGLRGIGCPEDTIKNIVMGDLRVASASKRAELERRILRTSEWSPPRGVSRQEYLAAQLRKLDRELDVTASDLMQSASKLDTPMAVAGVGAEKSADNGPPVRYPAVMEDVSFQTAPESTTTTTSDSGGRAASSKPLSYVAPGVVEASPEVLASIHEIQENFVQDIGGPNQDVEDPQYENNWRTAQWKADQIFRAKYGWAAYNDLVRAAVMKAYEAQRAAAGK